MVYKDKTWCAMRKCKNFDDCDRALTDNVILAAVKWWGDDNPPLSMSDQFDCFEPKNKKE